MTSPKSLIPYEEVPCSRTRCVERDDSVSSSPCIGWNRNRQSGEQRHFDKPRQSLFHDVSPLTCLCFVARAAETLRQPEMLRAEMVFGSRQGRSGAPPSLARSSKPQRRRPLATLASRATGSARLFRSAQV